MRLDGGKGLKQKPIIVENQKLSLRGPELEGKH